MSVVLVIVGRVDVTAGPHGTAAAGLRLKKAVCIPGGAADRDRDTDTETDTETDTDIDAHV